MIKLLKSGDISNRMILLWNLRMVKIAGFPPRSQWRFLSPGTPLNEITGNSIAIMDHWVIESLNYLNDYLKSIDYHNGPLIVIRLNDYLRVEILQWTIESLSQSTDYWPAISLANPSTWKIPVTQRDLTTHCRDITHCSVHSFDPRTYQNVGGNMPKIATIYV